MKFVKCHYYEKNIIAEVQEEHKEEPKEPAADEQTEVDTTVPLVFRLNNILHSILSNVKVYMNNHQFYNSFGLYVNESFITGSFKGAVSGNNGVWHCEKSGYEECPDGTMCASWYGTFSPRERSDE